MNVCFDPFPILETARYKLRAIELSDAPEFFVLRSDKRVLHYIHKEPALSINEAIDWINLITQAMHEGKSVTWAIVPKNQSKLIGTICFWNIDVEARRIEIGYSLLAAYQNKGVMKEVIQPIINFGLKSIIADCIEAYTHTENLASRKLLENNSFQRNFTLENSKVGITEPVTSIIYTLENKCK